MEQFRVEPSELFVRRTTDDDAWKHDVVVHRQPIDESGNDGGLRLFALGEFDPSIALIDRNDAAKGRLHGGGHFSAATHRVIKPGRTMSSPWRM
jgi:hypothetical protein